MFQALFSENKLCFLPFFSKAKPVVVNTTPVRMSVPLVSAQTVKQVSVTELVFPVSPKQTIQFYNWKLRFTYKRYMLNGEAVKFTFVNSSFFKVVPKPINPTSQIVTTSQPQQRLIMPATPLPQIQPNLTNLPPGTVLAPAPGTGNVGYAVLPAQYVTQVWEKNGVVAFQKGWFGLRCAVLSHSETTQKHLTQYENASF